MAFSVFSRISRIAERLISGSVYRTEPLVHGFNPIRQPSAGSITNSLIKVEIRLLHRKSLPYAFWCEDVKLKSYFESIRPPTRKTFGFRVGSTIIKRFPKRTHIHVFAPRRPERLKQGDKSRPGELKPHWLACQKDRPIQIRCLDERNQVKAPKRAEPEKQNGVRIWPSKAVLCQSNQFMRQRWQQMLTKAIFQKSGFSTSTSPGATDKEVNQSGDQNYASQETPEDESGVNPRNSAAEEQENDADEEPELSMDDLVKLVAEKEELLKSKHKEIEKMQDKVLRSYAEMENVIDRTKREAENSKKFAVQNFAKILLDVADNLGRASSVVKESFSKIDESKDTVGAVPLLKSLLDGVEMTDNQLAEVFKKFGVEKFDPMNELFDPHRHLAVFQVPDPTKPPGIVAVVLKSGYMLYDRVIRPAEVGVTEASNKETDERPNE